MLLDIALFILGLVLLETVIDTWSHSKDLEQDVNKD